MAAAAAAGLAAGGGGSHHLYCLRTLHSIESPLCAFIPTIASIWMWRVASSRSRIDEPPVTSANTIDAVLSCASCPRTFSLTSLTTFEHVSNAFLKRSWVGVPGDADFTTCWKSKGYTHIRCTGRKSIC